MMGLKGGSVKLLSHQEEWNKNVEKSLVKMGGEQGIEGIPRLLIEVLWDQGLRFGWCWDVVHLTTEIPKHLDDTDRIFLDGLLPWLPGLPANCRKPDKDEVK